MKKIFEKNISTEKSKLKTLLLKLSKITKESPEYMPLYKEKNKIVDELYNSGIKSIEFNKKPYSLLDDKNAREITSVVKQTPTTITKFDQFKNLDVKSRDVATDIDKKVVPMNPQTSLKKMYDMSDIVTIKTTKHNIQAVYMGLVGQDVQDILSKINTKFEKSDPFDGVFVLVRSTAPEIFAKKNIDILLINENLIGAEQIIKGYKSDGSLICKFKVTINSVKLTEIKNMDKIAASKIHNIEGTLLEKINSNQFKEYMKSLNEKVNVMKFEALYSSDFIEIDE